MVLETNLDLALEAALQMNTNEDVEEDDVCTYSTHALAFKSPQAGRSYFLWHFVLPAMPRNSTYRSFIREVDGKLDKKALLKAVRAKLRHMNEMSAANHRWTGDLAFAVFEEIGTRAEIRANSNGTYDVSNVPLRNPANELLPTETPLAELPFMSYGRYEEQYAGSAPHAHMIVRHCLSQID
jgi:hypothetical protein